MKKVVSAGGIILRRINNKVEMLLTYNSHFKMWVIPKGHIEKGETIKKAAIREIKEETGLTNFKLVSKLGVVTRPSKEHSGEIVDKDIHIFVFKTDSNVTPIPKEDYRKTEWFELLEGIDKIYFKPERDFLMSKIKELEKV